MTQQEHSTTLRQAWRLATAAAVALGALGATGLAQARDNVYWSVGIQPAPGVAVGVGNVRPMVVTPAPVYVQPQPVYLAPQPVYVAPAPVIVRPAPVYDAGPVVYGQPRHWRHKHWHRHHRARW